VLGAQPQGVEGAGMLARLVAHYADRAGVGARFTVTPGTVVCPRVTDGGQTLWIVVNMDGKGGEVTLPRAATDAFAGTAIPTSTLRLGGYEWRALRL